MGAEFVIIFISVVFLICGLVLLVSESGGRKAGFYMLLLGLIGIFICVVAYPKDKNYETDVRYETL